jgi:tRNA (cmo5U34)-methyltransferase
MRAPRADVTNAATRRRRGAAAHLGIDLREYDARIRTFIPSYELLLDITAYALARIVSRRAPVIVDLGIGTGALSARCLAAKPDARLVGIDEDEAMLAAARTRLGDRATLVDGSFESVPLPRCDAIVSSLALHHVPTHARRLRLFRRCFRALRPGGVLITADCYLSSNIRLQVSDRLEWLDHLRTNYTGAESRGLLRAWAKEDYYTRVADEIALLQRARFTVDVVGRRSAFAVFAAAK